MTKWKRDRTMQALADLNAKHNMPPVVELKANLEADTVTLAEGMFKRGHEVDAAKLALKDWLS